jgi:hypothetical protein
VEEAKKAEVAGTAAIVKAATQASKEALKQANMRKTVKNGPKAAKKALAHAKPPAAVAEKGAAAEVKTGKKGQVLCVWGEGGAGGGGCILLLP